MSKHGRSLRLRATERRKVVRVLHIERLRWHARRTLLLRALVLTIFARLPPTASPAAVSRPLRAATVPIRRLCICSSSIIDQLIEKPAIRRWAIAITYHAKNSLRASEFVANGHDAR